MLAVKASGFGVGVHTRSGPVGRTERSLVGGVLMNLRSKGPPRGRCVLVDFGGGWMGWRRGPPQPWALRLHRSGCT